jgi:hypothetical protein
VGVVTALQAQDLVTTLDSAPSVATSVIAHRGPVPARHTATPSRLHHQQAFAGLLCKTRTIRILVSAVSHVIMAIAHLQLVVWSEYNR